jgi:hypothetical protein
MLSHRPTVLRSYPRIFFCVLQCLLRFNLSFLLTTEYAEYTEIRSTACSPAWTSFSSVSFCIFCGRFTSFFNHRIHRNCRINLLGLRLETLVCFLNSYWPQMDKMHVDAEDP